MTAAEMSETSASALDVALDALSRAYTDVVAVIAAMPDGQLAFAGATQVGEVLQALSENTAGVRAAIAADIRMRLILSAVRRYR
jgi:hypothetical protein